MDDRAIRRRHGEERPRPDGVVAERRTSPASDASPNAGEALARMRLGHFDVRTRLQLLAQLQASAGNVAVARALGPAGIAPRPNATEVIQRRDDSDEEEPGEEEVTEEAPEGGAEEPAAPEEVAPAEAGAEEGAPEAPGEEPGTPEEGAPAPGAPEEVPLARPGEAGAEEGAPAEARRRPGGGRGPEEGAPEAPTEEPAAPEEGAPEPGAPEEVPLARPGEAGAEEGAPAEAPEAGAEEAPPGGTEEAPTGGGEEGAPGTAEETAGEEDETTARARTEFDAGADAYNSGDYETALARFKASYDIAGRPNEIWDMAQCLRGLGRNEEAIEMYRAYIEAAPDGTHVAGAQSWIATLSGEGGEETAGEEDETTARARTEFDAGADAYNSGDYETALARFKASYDIAGRPNEIWDMAQCLRGLGRNEEAIEMYRAYIEAAPDGTHVAGAQSWIATLSGEGGEETTGEEDETTARARTEFDAGADAYNSGDYETALARFKASYDIAGRPNEIWDMAQCLRGLGRNEEAIEMYRAYIEAAPDGTHVAGAQSWIATLSGEGGEEAGGGGRLILVHRRRRAADPARDPPS